MTQPRPVTKRDWLIPAALLVCPILSFGTAVASLALRRRLIDSCEPFSSSDPGEGWYVLFFLGPLVTVVAFIAISIAYGATAVAWGRQHPWVPILASMLVAVVMVYVAVSFMDVPGYTPDCPQGRPLWWPTWIPL